MTKRVGREAGAALVMVVMALGLITSLSVALLLSSSAEVGIAANFSAQRTAWYAADAIAERALIDIIAAPDWTPLTAGLIQSSFTDGPAGVRTLDDGSRLDLGTVVNVAGCQRLTPCSDAELDAVAPHRPWGPRNPRWRLYAWGHVGDLVPDSTPNVPGYVVPMVAGPPAGDNGIVARAEAFGPRKAHAIVEVTVIRDDTDRDYNAPGGAKVIAWRELP